MGDFFVLFLNIFLVTCIYVCVCAFVHMIAMPVEAEVIILYHIMLLAARKGYWELNSHLYRDPQPTFFFKVGSQLCTLVGLKCAMLACNSNICFPMLLECWD